MNYATIDDQNSKNYEVIKEQDITVLLEKKAVFFVVGTVMDYEVKILVIPILYHYNNYFLYLLYFYCACIYLCAIYRRRIYRQSSRSTTRMPRAPVDAEKASISKICILFQKSSSRSINSLLSDSIHDNMNVTCTHDVYVCVILYVV